MALLLKAGASADMGSRAGISPLYIATQHGSDSCVALLLQHGASPDLASNGVSPLLIASFLGYAGCARLLLNAGADLGLLYKTGETAEAMSRNIGAEECTRLLVRARQMRTSEGQATAVCDGAAPCMSSP